MTTGILISCVVVFVLLLLWIKAKIASKKPVEQRSSIDTILVSIFVMGKKNVEETANAIRTPEISKEEAMQKTKEAIQSLQTDYNNQLKSLLLTKARLEDTVLPKLKNEPGKYFAKSQKTKKEYLKAKDAANNASSPETKAKYEKLAEALKKNTIMFLDMNHKAGKRIEKCEQQILEITTNVELSNAEYDARKAKLDDILTDLETTVTANLSTAKFNSNLSIIESLRRETADKLREQNVSIEAENRISGETSETNDFNESDYEDEFENLK